MPPKKGGAKKGGAKKGGAGGGGKKGKGGGVKKGKSKGKKVKDEGPLEWKLDQKRLEALQAEAKKSPLMAQLSGELAHLHVPFPPRPPFRHRGNVPGAIMLYGIAPEDAAGVLRVKAPIYPVLDVCDRVAVSRCWRAVRMHFLPTRKSSWVLRQERGGGDLADDDDDQGGAGGYDDDDGILADDDPASCGHLTLHGISRWLNSRGERFPAPGFPCKRSRSIISYHFHSFHSSFIHSFIHSFIRAWIHAFISSHFTYFIISSSIFRPTLSCQSTTDDEVVWRPLEVLVLRYFHRMQDGSGRILARWRQDPSACRPLVKAVRGAEHREKLRFEVDSLVAAA